MESARLQEEEKDKLRVEFISNCCTFFFFMNTSVAPFNNPKVRQAVNLALHRQALLKTFGAPGFDTLAPPLGVGTWFGRTVEEIAQLPGWREVNGEKHPDDIAKAKALLAEAGYPDGFKADMMVRQVVEFPDQAVLYKEQLKKIGIEATIRLVDSATGFQRYAKGPGTPGTLLLTGGRRPIPGRRASLTGRSARPSSARWRTTSSSRIPAAVQ